MPRNVFDRRRGINTGSVIIHTLDVRRTGMYLKHDNRTLGGYSDLRRMNECASSHTMYTAYRLVRYTKVHLDFCLRFSTLSGQIGGVPLFGAGPRRCIRCSYAGWPTLFPGVPLPLPGGKKASECRSFLGPFALQNCLRILRPGALETVRNRHFGTTRSKSYRPLRHLAPRNHGSQRRSQGGKVFNYQRYIIAAAPTGGESFPFKDIHHHSST